MKLFRSRQLGTILILLAGSLLASNLVFDRIANGAPYRGTIEHCSNINKLINPGADRCINVGYMLQDYGWPFVASRVAETRGQKIEVTSNSIALDKRLDFYASLNSLALFVSATTLYLLVMRYAWKHFAFTHPFDMPVIQSSDMLDEAGLMPLAQGELAGYQYSFLTNSKGRTMLNIVLKRNTGIHVVAVGSKSISSLPFSERLESRFLKPVRLEGDFPEYFHLYCTPGKERELLQIFDPATMARLIDFCKAYQFEIFHDSLYVSQAADAEDLQDDTTMVADAKTLLEKSGDTFDRLK